MSSRHKSEIASCANCGAGYTRKIVANGILYDEKSGSFFCDRDCYEEWADFDRTPVEYYAEINLREVVEI